MWHQKKVDASNIMIHSRLAEFLVVETMLNLDPLAISRNPLATGNPHLRQDRFAHAHDRKRREGRGSDSVGPSFVIRKCASSIVHPWRFNNHLVLVRRNMRNALRRMQWAHDLQIPSVSSRARRVYAAAACVARGQTLST